MDSSAAGFTEPVDEVPPPPLYGSSGEVLPPLDGSSGDTAAVKPIWNEPAKGSMAVLGISIWPSLSDAKQAFRKSSSSSSGSLRRLSEESISDNASVTSSQNLNNENPIPARNHGAHTHQNFSRNAGTRTNQEPAPSLPRPVSPQMPGFPQTRPHGGGLQHGNNQGPAPPLPRPVSSQMPGIREFFPQTRHHGGGLQNRSHANDQRKNHGGNHWFNNDSRNNDNISVQEQQGLNDRRQRSTGIGLQPPAPQGVYPFYRPAVPFFQPAINGVPGPFIPHDPRFMPSMGYPDLSYPINYAAAPPTPPPWNYAAAPPPPPMNYAPIARPTSLPMLDAQRMQVLNQVEYYFSADNLARNSHLRRNMDEQGWISVSLIASFPRIKEFTQNIFDDRVREAFVLGTVSSSAAVEVRVRDGKIRRRNDWAKWTLRRHVE